MLVDLTYELDGHVFRNLGIRLGDHITVQLRGSQRTFFGHVVGEVENQVQDWYTLTLRVHDIDLPSLATLKQSQPSDWIIQRAMRTAVACALTETGMHP
jgi:hypothetical protein